MAAQAQSGNRGEVSEAVRHATAKLSQDLARTAQDAQAAASEFAAAVQHTVADLGEDAARQAVGAKHAVEARIRRHPITWVAAAAGAGALLGVILAGRR